MPASHNPPGFSRRQLLQALGSGFALNASCIPSVWAQPAPPGARRLGQGRLVVVFLRGAYDGLSAFVPYADADYYAIRPNIAIAAPDGTAQTAIKLDNTFALHPALAPLLPLWQQDMSKLPGRGTNARRIRAISGVRPGTRPRSGLEFTRWPENERA